MKVWIRYAGSDAALDNFAAGRTLHYNFLDQDARFSIGDIAFVVFGPVDDPEAGNIAGWERVTHAKGEEWTTEVGQVFGQPFDGRELRLLPEWRILRGPRHIGKAGRPENSREIPTSALRPFLQFVRDKGERIPPELLGMVGQDRFPSTDEDLDTYVTGEFVNEGVHGKVYKAYHRSLERHVAIKFLKADAAAAVELRRQARALAKVQHANVVTVFDLARARNPDSGNLEPCIVMELLSGAVDLEEALQGGITLERAESLARGVLRGLLAIHAEGLSHRDIHDGNVMVTDDGPKLIDLHVLESASRASTRTREAGVRADLNGALLLVRTILFAASVDVSVIDGFCRVARLAGDMQGILDAFENLRITSGTARVPATQVRLADTTTPRGAHPPERVTYWRGKLSKWVGARVIVRDVDYDNYPLVEEPVDLPPNRPSAWFRASLWEVSEQGPVLGSAADYTLYLLMWEAIESISFSGDEYHGEPNILFRYHPERYFEVARRKIPPRVRVNT